MDNQSILDQIIENRQSEILADFHPKPILENLSQNLSEREKMVIFLRYGLSQPQKNTLEQIGQQFKVTRERIRQIENTALKKMRDHPQFDEVVKPVEQIINRTLEEYGGIMRHDFLIDKILVSPSATTENKFLASFIIEQLIANRLSYNPETVKLYAGWKLPATAVEAVETALGAIQQILTEHQEPLDVNSIIQKLSEQNNSVEKFNDNTVRSYLIISRQIEENPFNEWGLENWPSINPRRMSDKIYLVLKKHQQPMHFSQIAERINQLNFDNKKANPATIHNELILDDKYVLVGRGIYALKEWGYQPGVVADVIKKIIKDNGPLSKDNIIEKVLEKRQVKKSTIVLALMNKNNFYKTADKKYALKEN